MKRTAYDAAIKYSKFGLYLAISITLHLSANSIEFISEIKICGL